MRESRLLSSSTIKSVTYDFIEQKLFVEFINGNIYKYEKIPQLAYANICTAPSPGKYIKHLSTMYKGEKVSAID